jgi:S-adenosylmethionine:tRNA ribosyltransferase-isomerase
MNDPRNISIQDFTYYLPEEKIASHPLQERDASKLLIYKDGSIKEAVYRNIADHIPEGSLLIFNNSKVINARIRFKKSSGSIIEIFCLEPIEMLNEYSSIMNKTASVKWKCFIGGAAKWKNGELSKKIIINNSELIIKAILLKKLPDGFVVEFSWVPAAYSFAEVIEAAGDIPLPPYIKRDTEITDATRYQTIYAKHEGSVAAPTAGLHFTESVFSKLSVKHIDKAYVTLHVGAGTFKPVKAATMHEHEMHAEWIDVNIETIKKILIKKDDVIAIGTTSLRTIETLYWIGVKALLTPEIKILYLDQWDVYEEPLLSSKINVKEALDALINWMGLRDMDRLFIQTQLLIAKGYQFKIVKALVTNFHQPQSTLLLLVAAAVGENWRMIYNYALEHDYRFLSYGDGNLIFIAPPKRELALKY